MLLYGHAYAQDREPAGATYANNGTLIGLTDLAPLRDCSVKVMQGKVKDLKARGGLVLFDLKAKKERMTFRFPINRLGSPEQLNFRKDFLHNGLLLRASGYACGTKDEPLEAITIDRVY